MSHVTEINMSLNEQGISDNNDNVNDDLNVDALSASMIGDILGTRRTNENKPEPTPAPLESEARIGDRMDAFIQRLEGLFSSKVTSLENDIQNNEKKLTMFAKETKNEMKSIKDYICQSEMVQKDNLMQLKNEIVLLEKKFETLDKTRPGTMNMPLHYAMTCTETLLRENIRFSGNLTSTMHPMD
jgi:hypothetical protein